MPILDKKVASEEINKKTGLTKKEKEHKIELLDEIIKKQKREFCDNIINNPQKGDVIIENPGTEREKKYEIISVTNWSINSWGNWRAPGNARIDIVKFCYTFHGQSVNYERPLEIFSESIKFVVSHEDIVEFLRKSEDVFYR